MWSVTINNPDVQDEDYINVARQRGWKVMGQLEKGENGTQHYQLAVRTPQVRFSAVKKLFPRAHIELARDPVALLRYVEKEATKVADLPTQQSKYPSLSKYWELVFLYLNGLGKDGLDYVGLEEGEVRFYYEERDKLYRKTPLLLLDEATASLIRQGYHVEGIGGNPSTRSQWKLYSADIILRSYDAVNSVTIETYQDAHETDRSAQDGGSVLQEASQHTETESEAEQVSEQGSDEGSEVCFTQRGGD